MIGQISLFIVGVGLGGGLFGCLSNLYNKRAQALIVEGFTQEKRVLQEENSNRKTVAFSALFEGFLGGAATLDDQGHILRSNRALHERLGYEDHDLQGRSLLGIVHPEDIVHVQNFLLSLVGKKSAPATSPHFSSELRCYTKEGKIVWVHLSLSVLHDADFAEGSETPRLLALLDDVTRRRQAEGVVARLGAGVNELYRLISDQQSDFDTQMQALLNLGCHLFDVHTGMLGKLNGHQLEIMSAVSPNKGLRRGNSYEMGNAKQRTELPASLRASRMEHWRDQPFVTMTQDETFLGAPIYVAGQLSGLLCFSDTATREVPFEAEQTQFCQLMALWIGSEIERRERYAQKAQQDAALLQSNAKWEAMATQDGLTGLKNRRAFDERLLAEFNRATQGTVPLSLMLMDVDKFKHFNDTFGHPAGDEVLKQVAKLLQGGVRAGGFVARYGGEEFVVLLPDTVIEDALITAERLRAIIEGGHWPQRAVTVSIGVASWSPGMTTTGQLVSAADGALYESKGAGRNRVTQATALPLA
ncbi:response regulator PleD [Abditibacteriota bacterium]|nr:response regulator PleD [Abditibacteriota bacterium]